MKLKRLLSCVPALAMVLSLAALPASAVTTFPDIQNHWAKSYIEAMTGANMFKGYDDGSFKPENRLTTAEALALCARAVRLDSSTALDIAADYYEEVKTTLNGEQSWFYQEFSICLATGILTQSDLKTLFQSGALTEPIRKEDLAVYLVRAMQLGPMSERLTSYPLPFDDASSISNRAKPSVYLLHVYGIVEGDEDNNFSPKLQVTRAIMSTMLTRAIAYMQSHGTSPDLPEYTDYAFRQGVIAAAPTESGGAIQLNLNSDLSGAPLGTITLPADAAIYENNMETSASALKMGRHARVCLDESGTPFAVRVSDTLETFDAAINGIDGYNVAVTVNGAGRILEMDRFTQVQIGAKTTGDRDIVNPSAGYTTAVCKVDDQGRLVSIQFAGGSRAVEGVIDGYTRSATGATTLQMVGFDGVNRTYTIPADAEVTVNGVGGIINSSHEGSYVSLKVSDEDNTVLSAAVNTEAKYVQGVVKSVDEDDNSITITRLSNNRSATYDLAGAATVTYDGENSDLEDIKRNYFVTLLLDKDDEVTLLQAYPSSTVTEGVITDRVFSAGADTVISFVVTQSDGTQVSFHVDLADPPAVERDEVDSTVDQLRIGDEVEFTVRYNEVTRIVANTQSVNVTGTVERIIQEKSGYTLDMKLSSGEEFSYTVDAGVTVSQGGETISLSELKPGYRLGMAVNGSQVVSIDVLQAVNSGNKLTGSILYVDYSERYIYLRAVTQTGDEEMVTVDVAGAVILDVATGEQLYLRDLETGHVVEVNGSYHGTIFEATIILKQ